MRFTTHELLLVTVIAALTVGWFLERRCSQRLAAAGALWQSRARTALLVVQEQNVNANWHGNDVVVAAVPPGSNAPMLKVFGGQKWVSRRFRR